MESPKREPTTKKTEKKTAKAGPPPPPPGAGHLAARAKLAPSLAALENPAAVPDGKLAVRIEELEDLDLPDLPDVEPQCPPWSCLAHHLGRDQDEIHHDTGTSSRAMLWYLARQAARVDPATRERLATLAELQRAAGTDLDPHEAAYAFDVLDDVLAGRLSPGAVPGVYSDGVDVLERIAEHYVTEGEAAAVLPDLLAQIRAAEELNAANLRAVREAWQARVAARVKAAVPADAVARMTPRELGHHAKRFYVEDALDLARRAVRTLEAARDAGDLARWGSGEAAP